MVDYPFARAESAVDVLMFTVPDFWTTSRSSEPRLEVALLKRSSEPFLGQLALPGTIVRVEADAEGRLDATDLDAAKRVMSDKMRIRPTHLEQLYTWFTRTADPRGPTTVIAYFAVVPFDHFRKADREILTFHPVDDLPKLAFNHNDIVRKAVERIRGKAMYSSMPALLMPECFTLRELKSMYEAVLGRTAESERLDFPNFSRKIAELGILESVGDDVPAAAAARERTAATGRKPQIYRLADRRLKTFERTAFDVEPTRRKS